ncbi:hypothetical protein CKA38_02680 [Ereboglobus luteus]|uniref:Uncharacterized protein n=2 Tax=Ereboglobus luteus TaxID=1796921 RepID=A0A2U8E0C3_9BACT|nr:hypothetical protein CKA38_02680 [Ereboglobus luteus]
MKKFEAIDCNTVKKLTAVKLDKKSGGEKYTNEISAISEISIGNVLSVGAHSILARLKYSVSDVEALIKLSNELEADSEIARQFLSLLIKHYRQQSIIAWNTPEPGDDILFNGQLFSAVAYTHLRPLVRYQGTKRIACPVLFEVLARSAESFDVEGFIERLRRAGDHTRSKLRLLGVMGATSLSPDALKLGKNHGLVMVNFRELFGETAVKMIQQARELLLSLSARRDEANAQDPNALADQMVTSISSLKSNPMVNELCGMALEIFTVAVLRSRNYEDVKARLTVPFSTNRENTVREIDASGHNDDVHYIVECKALKADKELKLDQIKKFFCETVPSYLKFIGKAEISKCHAEIWTTGKVTPEASAYLNSLNLDRRVKRGILARQDIKIPKNIASLSRILEVIADC